MKALYKYPQAEFPYARLVEENRRRGKHEPEFELADTGVFDGGRYFDVFAEYAKTAPDDILIRITVANRGPEAARLHLLPTLWFRNTWSWGRTGEGYWARALDRGGERERPPGRARRPRAVPPLRRGEAGARRSCLFTENETNAARLFGGANASPYVKDAFHEYVVGERRDAVNPERPGRRPPRSTGSRVPAGGEAVLRLRLCAESQAPREPFGPDFDRVFEAA